MENPFAKLALDHWYKVLMTAGFAVFLMVGAGLLPLLPPKPSLLLALGAFFFGLGEWRNHPIQNRLVPGLGIATSYPRSPCAIGLAFDGVGVASGITGLVMLLQV